MKKDIKIYSLGCRLNALEAEKIRRMLISGGIKRAAIVNTCAVTSEALRQSRQQFHKIVRENPDAPVFITGCGATLKPEDFAGQNARVISNKDKFNPNAYGVETRDTKYEIRNFEKMKKKGFVQIGDGCDRRCTYCVTRTLRGPALHFPYEQIRIAARALLENGYEEIILTGVNIADWTDERGGLADLCRRLLYDFPEMKALTLSSLDPAADVEGLIDLMRTGPRMTRHLHLSVQSGCDWILGRMGRRHNAARIREIARYANGDATFSWDIICGFPGEAEERFAETLDLAKELCPTKIHAFPFSARPGTAAAEMLDKVTRAAAKERVRKLCL